MAIKNLNIAESKLKNNVKLLVTLAMLSIGVFGAVGLFAHPTFAATPPDSCFAFNAGTGTITNYYAHEANNPANPACTRDVDIPSTIGGVAVTAIGAADSWWYPPNATSFAYKNLTSVNMPNSIISMGSRAFVGNQITAATISTNLTSIEDLAFSGNQLTTVSIPASVTSIGDFAFYSNQLATIVIPASVTSIGNDVFAFNQLDTIVISNGVTSIGDYAFYSNQLTSVTIPNSVTTIGNSAFSNNQLTSATLSNSMTSISDRLFSSNLLNNITLPSDLIDIGEYAFINNRLETVDAPSTLSNIGYGAFALQSKWGRDIDDASNGAPFLWSDNPAEVQAAYDGISFVRLYIADDVSASGLTSQTFFEDDWWGSDANANGLNDSYGGHIINPASATISYRNATNTSLQQSLTFTGMVDDTTIQDYLVKNGPLIPQPVNPYYPTPEEALATQEAFSAYHRLGDSVTFTPPSISGYQTPAPATLTLSQPTNQHTFVYAANPAGPTNPTTPPVKHTGAPKLTKVTWTNAKPTLRGLFDSSNTSRLSITFAGQAYVLGESAELTAEGDSWTLDLTSSTTIFETDTYEVTIETTDADGNILSTEEAATLTQAMLDGREGELAETGESRMYAVGGAVTLLLAGSYALIRVNRTAKRGNV